MSAEKRKSMNGEVWTFIRRKKDVDGNDVIEAITDSGYPSEFAACEWLLMEVV